MIEAFLLAMVLGAPCDNAVCPLADAPRTVVAIQATGEVVAEAKKAPTARRAKARRVRVAAGKIVAAPVRLIGRVVQRVRHRERFRPLRRIIERRRSGCRLLFRRR